MGDVTTGSIGGWGFFIKKSDKTTIEGSGYAVKTNSKIMEYTAIEKALEALPEESDATVFSDSQSAIEICSKTLKIYAENGWKNVDTQILEILQNIHSLIEDKSLLITWQWVRSHNGNAGNERADELASEAVRSIKTKFREAEKESKKSGKVTKKIVIKKNNNE